MVYIFFYLILNVSLHLELLEVDVLRVAVLLGLDVAVVVTVGHIGATDVAFSNGFCLLGFAPQFSIGLDLDLRRNRFLTLFV